MSRMGQGAPAGQPVLRVISNTGFPGKPPEADKIAVAG